LSNLSLEDKGEYALGRAFCLYYSGEKARSLETIDSILSNLESQGITNSVYLRLVVGLAAIHSSLGDYQGAVLIAEKGIQVARKMGEERKLGMLAANLALAHCRLGDTNAQLYWAGRAALRPESSTDLFHHQQVHYLRAQAFAIQGRVSESLAALAEGRGTDGQHRLSYLRQAWQVRAADVLSLLGREAESLRAAREGVTGEMRVLHSDSFAGPHSRWSAKLAVADRRDAVDVRASLVGLLDRARLLDHIDQAEVLNAKVWLDSRTGIVDEGERSEMWRRLGNLPTGVADDLKRLGMLDL
jgi:tetratricopeptide (TPR) repeat protein